MKDERKFQYLKRLTEAVENLYFVTYKLWRIEASKYNRELREQNRVKKKVKP